MVFLWSELCARHHDIFSAWVVQRTTINQVLGVTGRVDKTDSLAVTPERSDVSVRPGAVSCNLSGEPAADWVYQHQDEVVNSLDHSEYKAACVLVVERVRVNLLEHVTANRRVVSIAQNLAPEKCLNQRVSKTHPNCVNKDVTWCIS